MQVERDYYRTLGVSVDADEGEIRNAYRQLVRRYHPDVCQEASAGQRFIAIQEAYEVVGDAEQRKAYDRWRAEQGLDHPPALRLEVTSSHEVLSSAVEKQLFYTYVEVLPAKNAGIERSPLNIGLVLDRSTSMKGEKLAKLKEATYQLIDSLHGEDILSLITFGDRASAVLSGYRGTHKPQMRAAVASISAGGGTEIYQGLQVGLDQVRLQHFGHAIDHLVLLTDGQTYGDEELCLQLAEEAARSNVSITTLGIGTDWNDALLDEIASRSGGASAFIEGPQQIARVLREKVRGVQTVFARNVRFVLRHTNEMHLKDAFQVMPQVARMRVEGGQVPIGDLEAEMPAAFLLEWMVDSLPSGMHRLFSLTVEGDIPSLERVGERVDHQVEVRLADVPGEEASPVPRIIVNSLERISAFRLQERVEQDLVAGRSRDASRRLQSLATRLISLGESQLAREALLEAGRISETGRLSAEGQKRLKYGTRRLSHSLEKRKP